LRQNMKKYMIVSLLWIIVFTSQSMDRQITIFELTSDPQNKLNRNSRGRTFLSESVTQMRSKSSSRSPGRSPLGSSQPIEVPKKKEKTAFNYHELSEYFCLNSFTPSPNSYGNYEGSRR
jgi:hypothetical protein